MLVTYHIIWSIVCDSGILSISIQHWFKMPRASWFVSRNTWIYISPDVQSITIHNANKSIRNCHTESTVWLCMMIYINYVVTFCMLIWYIWYNKSILRRNKQQQDKTSSQQGRTVILTYMINMLNLSRYGIYGRYDVIWVISLFVTTS